MTPESILKQFPYFNRMSDALLSEFVQRGRAKYMTAGDIICLEGETSTSMYIIISGEVQVYKNDGVGNNITLSKLKMGDFLGELSFLDNQPRSASAKCLSDCNLFIIDQESFIGFFKTHPEMIRHVVRALTIRMRERIEGEFKRELTKQAVRAEAELERHRSLSQMVAGVAHELNTPLGIANMSADIISKRLASPGISAVTDASPQTATHLADIQEASDLLQRNIIRAHRLIENFKKISVNQLTDTLTTVTLPELIADILSLVKVSLRQAALKIDIEHSLTESNQVWVGYPGYLSQILLNLISNVERYAYPNQKGGQVQISIAQTRLRNLPAFEITTLDFGEGITAENLPHILEPFFTTGRGQGGTGLGMSIVYNLVTEALQGTIQVESTPKKGTAVKIVIPQQLTKTEA